MTSLFTGSAARIALVALAASIALIAQNTIFPHLAWHGVVPNLVLLVVVAGGLTRGAHFGMVLGFGAGVLLDLAPPADHVAGRWALALLVVGYVAGQVRQEVTPSVLHSVATVGACSFLGSSLFAVTGLVLQDPPGTVPDLLQVVLVGVAWDVVLAPFVLPAMMKTLIVLEPERLSI